jgi:hypothetical protein
MNEQFSEEFLSAYVDGELSAQSRAAVERWLERSPEARQKLEDFRQLSRLFGDLSRTEVPDEFSTEVLHLAERRMLLPAADAVRGRIRIRRWAMVVSASAVAAMLLLIVTISNRDPVARNGGGLVANLPAPTPVRSGDDVKPSGLDDLGNPSGAAKPSDALIAQRESARPIVRGAGGGSGLSPSAAPAVAAGSAGREAAKSNVGEPGAAERRVASVAASGPAADNIEANPQLQAITEAVQQIRESGAEDKILLIVKMYVIDRAEGLVLLQDNFALNDIRREADDTAPATAGDRANPKDMTATAYEGLYIEAQPEAVIAAFKTTLDRRHPGLRLSVDQSIELAALDGQLQQQLSRSEGAWLSAGQRRGDDATKIGNDAREGAKSAVSRAAAPAGEAVPQKKTAASTANSRAKQQPGLDKGGVERQSRAVPPEVNESDSREESDAQPEASQIASNGRQVVVPVVPPAIQNRAQSRVAANSPGTKGLAGSSKQNSPVAAADAKSRDTKPLTQDKEPDGLGGPAPALVRMLIVIEPESPQPAAPKAKDGPSGGAS